MHPSMHSDLRSEDLRHFSLIVCDTWNKQLNPTSCQLVPLYLMLMKVSFPHRDTGKKILEKMISRYPQLAVGKGRASQRQWGAKTIVPQDRPGTNRRADAQESQAWDRESLPTAIVADPHTPGPFPGQSLARVARAFTEAEKAELPFCWTVDFQFKIQIMYFRVEL